MNTIFNIQEEIDQAMDELRSKKITPRFLDPHPNDLEDDFLFSKNAHCGSCDGTGRYCRACGFSPGDCLCNDDEMVLVECLACQ
jgi:hypothetical protein